MGFVIDKDKVTLCKCGCGGMTSGMRKYRKGKCYYPEYCHGHHMVGKSGTSHPTFGKPSWNAGLTKDVCPTLAKMGYQPGHQPYNDFSKINNLLKSDPDFKEKWRLAKKGKTPWNKLKPFEQHALAARQMNGFGGMISMELATDLAGTRRFLESCRIFALAESLGGVESLIEHPGLMTHSQLAPERRRELGIGDGLIRISAGIEDVRDLIADLEQALPAMG